jgi:DNA-binding NarL/FixJ family response regulator
VKRLVLADDSVLFREGMARVLEDLGFEVVGQAEDGEGLLDLVDQVSPDLAIVDIRMPPTRTDEGLRAAHDLGQRHPAVGVLVLSHYLDASYALGLLNHGDPGRGYLLKDTVADLDTFGDAVRTVAEGGCVVDPQVVADLVGGSQTPAALEGLTVRELEILSLMAEGRSNAGICDRLMLSPRTIESHVRVVLRKLGLEEATDTHRRVLAVITYLRAATEQGAGMFVSAAGIPADGPASGH